MTAEAATAAVSVSPQWLALRLGEHFPELPPETVRWDSATAARILARAVCGPGGFGGDGGRCLGGRCCLGRGVSVGDVVLDALVA